MREDAAPTSKDAPAVLAEEGGGSEGRSKEARKLLAGILLSASTLIASSPAWPWGDRTHQLVNRLAVDTLPPAAAAYFRPHVEDLARMSVEPDSVMRAREGQAEAIRHFIDLDAHLPPPFRDFPRSHREAVRRFGKARVDRHGVLPWTIQRFQRQLRAAIRAGDVPRARREAAYLGHYVADAHMPLHLTANHDGQLTGAKGLHKRFEDGLVDARIARYATAARSWLRPAQPVRNLSSAVFGAIFESYGGVDAILRADRAARRNSRRESPEYYAVMDDRLAPLVGRQLAGAATLLGSLWLTAWEQAGSPGAATLDPPGVRR